MRISAIILASGYSNRFGKNKLLLNYKSRTLFESIIIKAQNCGFDEVIAVIKPEDELLVSIANGHGVKIAFCHDAEKGQSASIKTGTAFANPENALMFFVSDQPFLTEGTIKRIMDCHEENESQIVVPICNNKRGNPCLFPNRYRGLLMLLEGDVGGKSIIKSSNNVMDLDIKNMQELWDIDTVDDYFKIIEKEIVIVRGGGDLATGVIQAIKRAGFYVIVLEIEKPSAIRRTVCLSEAIYADKVTVEDITAEFIKEISPLDIIDCIDRGNVPILVDPTAEIIKKIKPVAVIDAIIAKKNCGTNKDMAMATIALGPGFIAGEDVDIVIETMRGHNLGRLIFEGKALENTGIPGIVNGIGKERVIYSPQKGEISLVKNIGDIVARDEIIAYVDGHPVLATIDGLLRGIIRDGFSVPKGMKIADIDPRISEKENCFTISDKARALGGATLQALMMILKNNSHNLL